MATAAVTQIDYNYEDYLAEWESCPDKPHRLTQAEFQATLNSYLSYTQQIGAAYAQQRTGKTRSEREEAQRLAEALRAQRRPLKQALLL